MKYMIAEVYEEKKCRTNLSPFNISIYIKSEKV